MKKFLSLICICISYLSTNALVRHVPTSYPTISAALAVCQPADTILVQPGTYVEQLVWPSIANIKLLSAGDSSNTVISAAQNGRAITMSSAQITNSTIIRGFSIRDGVLLGNSSQGGGIHLTNGSPTLDGLLIEQNRLGSPNWNYGGGIYISGGTANIMNCAIRNNFIDSATWGHGCGLYIVNGANVQINNTSIDHNQTTSGSWCYGVGIYMSASEATISSCKIIENRAMDGASYFRGMGVYVDDATLNLENVLIASNIMGNGGNFMTGGGLHITGASSLVSLKHVTIAENYRVGNLAISGSGINVAGGTLTMINSISYNANTGPEFNVTGGTMNASYSNIRGTIAGTGNINNLPQFVSSSDFHLGPGSPCFGTGSPTLVLNNDLDGLSRPIPLGTNPDMGCYEIDHTIVGTKENKTETFFVSPNPASEISTLYYLDKNAFNENIMVYDQSVRTIAVLKTTGSPLQINTSEWNPGMYYCTWGTQHTLLIKN